MNRVFLTPAAVALCGAFSLSLAEPVSLADQVVTATRTTQITSQSLAAMSVIDREDIERSQARSVPELLRQVPGVSLANNGGFGKNTTLLLRGTESDHVLVLIDDIKVGSASAGLTAFQDLPVELIERIEVVRGPRSSLYDSKAIGGVTQIFTRRGDGQGVKPLFSADYGTHRTLEGSAGVNGGVGNGWYSLGASSFDMAGINTERAGTAGYKPDRDGYRNLLGNLHGDYRFDNGLELDGTLLRAKLHDDYGQVFGNPGFNANADGEQNLVGGRVRFTPLDPWLVTLQAGRGEDKVDAYQDGRFYSRFDTRRDSLFRQNNLTLAEGYVLTLGYDWRKDEINSSETFSIDSRLNKGWFAQYLGRYGRQDWQLSLRRDDNQQFGAYDTGSAAWGYALSDALRFTVSYGTASKAPTFSEFYYPDYDNPDLDAEISRSLEARLSGTHGWGHRAVNAFRTSVDDLIDNDPRPAPGCPWGQPNNIDEARIRGVELILDSQWLGWDWNANATFLDSQNRSDGVNGGNELPRWARRMFNLELDRRSECLSLGANVHAEDRRYDDPANKVRLGGYATLDLRGEYRPNDEWHLRGRTANLFDANYETAYGHNQPGQAVYLSVRYQAL